MQNQLEIGDENTQKEWHYTPSSTHANIFINTDLKAPPPIFYKVVFTVESKKNSLPEAIVSINARDEVYINPKYILEKLGFKQETAACWSHPLLGENIFDNWLEFDPKTDDLAILVRKIQKITIQNASITLYPEEKSENY